LRGERFGLAGLGRLAEHDHRQEGTMTIMAALYTTQKFARSTVPQASTSSRRRGLVRAASRRPLA
jgi:hypothetical protein